MQHATTIDDVLAAAAAVRTTFENIPPEPVPVKSVASIEADESLAIVERYERHGFAIVQLMAHETTTDALLDLADGLGLGAPFTPPLYKVGLGAPASISTIAAKPVASLGEPHHPSFEGTAGLRFHCDGTLQPIGYVKVSVLLCQSRAAEGGDTTMFNAAAAYSLLATVDAPAAIALATSGVLIRQANINGCVDVNAGPAFAVDEGQLVCCYSVSDTDRWAAVEGVDAAALHRGVGFLLHASLPGSPFYTQLTLEAGQVILFDNTRVSHGRTPYVDAPEQRRCLFRSLHLRHPRTRVLETADTSGGREGAA
jgi:hypothetical protein